MPMQHQFHFPRLYLSYYILQVVSLILKVHVVLVSCALCCAVCVHGCACLSYHNGRLSAPYSLSLSLQVLGLALALGAYRHHLDGERLFNWTRPLATADLRVLAAVMEGVDLDDPRYHGACIMCTAHKVPAKSLRRHARARGI